MSDDTTENNSTDKDINTLGIKNRKQRRYEAKLARQAPKEYRDYYHWHRRFVNEMKQNKVVQEKIVSGKFDHFLAQSDELPE